MLGTVDFCDGTSEEAKEPKVALLDVGTVPVSDDRSNSIGELEAVSLDLFDSISGDG